MIIIEYVSGTKSQKNSIIIASAQFRIRKNTEIVRAQKRLKYLKYTNNCQFPVLPKTAMFYCNRKYAKGRLTIVIVANLLFTVGSYCRLHPTFLATLSENGNNMQILAQRPAAIGGAGPVIRGQRRRVITFARTVVKINHTLCG